MQKSFLGDMFGSKNCLIFKVMANSVMLKIRKQKNATHNTYICMQYCKRVDPKEQYLALQLK